MIKVALPKAARALLGIGQCRQADASALSLPIIQRMEASDRKLRSIVDSLAKPIDVLLGRGVQGERVGTLSEGIRGGVRMKARFSAVGATGRKAGGLEREPNA
jgi:hypothetical protein